MDRAERSRVSLCVAPETPVNEPMLKDRTADLRRALAEALRQEGFAAVGAGSSEGALLVTTSVDYTPWTSVNAANLFVVV